MQSASGKAGCFGDSSFCKWQGILGTFLHAGQLADAVEDHGSGIENAGPQCDADNRAAPWHALWGVGNVPWALPVADDVEADEEEFAFPDYW